MLTSSAIGDSVIHYDYYETVGPVGHVLEGRLSALYTWRIKNCPSATVKTILKHKKKKYRTLQCLINYFKK